MSSKSMHSSEFIKPLFDTGFTCILPRVAMTAPPMVPMVPATAPQIAMPQIGMPVGMPTAMPVGMPSAVPQIGMPTVVPIMNMPVMPQQPSQPSDAIQKAMEATLASISLPPPNMGAGDALNVMYVALLFRISRHLLPLHLSPAFMWGRYMMHPCGSVVHFLEPNSITTVWRVCVCTSSRI